MKLIYYTVDEVADLLKVHPQTIRRWLRRGELTGADTPAGWRITTADLDAWLNKHRHPAQPTTQQEAAP